MLSLALALVMAVTVLPTAGSARQIAGTEQAAQTAESLTQAGEQTTVTEVVALREENVKHYDMGDGTFQAIAYGHPVHELDENGQWQDIDFSLSLTQNSGVSTYANDAAGVAFSAAYTPNRPIMTLSDEDSAISLTLVTNTASGNLTTRNAGTAVAAEVLNPQNSFDTVEDANNATFSSTIMYEDILPGIDLEYIVDPGTVKENIIVKERAASYEYGFTLDLEGLYPVMQDDGSINVYDEITDEEKYAIPAPFMYDALGNISEDVFYTLNQAGQTYSLTVTANAEWINTQAQAFPVVIDPTISRETEEVYDTYIDSDNPNTPHGSSSQLWIRANRITYLKFPMPALPENAELTSAYLTAYYYYFNHITSGSVGISAHRINLSGWDESTLTWNAVCELTNYGLATTFLRTDMASASVGATIVNPGIVDFLITDTVQDWLERSYANNGIGLKYIDGSANLSVIIKSSEANYSQRPRVRYEYTYTPYNATVNCYFDDGCSIYYGETQTESQSNIASYLNAVAARYSELFHLNLTLSAPQHINSAIDLCKGSVSSGNIDQLCACGANHTDLETAAANFQASYGGSRTVTNILWSGHRITTTSASGELQDGRSGFNGMVVVMVRQTEAGRSMLSQSGLMHELNHRFGARDHYHELADKDDPNSCIHSDICSECGSDKRPKSCIMNNSQQAITSDTIICDACKADILAYLEIYH